MTIPTFPGDRDLERGALKGAYLRDRAGPPGVLAWILSGVRAPSKTELGRGKWARATHKLQNCCLCVFVSKVAKVMNPKA